MKYKRKQQQQNSSIRKNAKVSKSLNTVNSLKTYWVDDAAAFSCTSVRTLHRMFAEANLVIDLISNVTFPVKLFKIKKTF